MSEFKKEEKKKEIERHPEKEKKSKWMDVNV